MTHHHTRFSFPLSPLGPRAVFHSVLRGHHQGRSRSCIDYTPHARTELQLQARHRQPIQQALSANIPAVYSVIIMKGSLVAFVKLPQEGVHVSVLDPGHIFLERHFDTLTSASISPSIY